MPCHSTGFFPCLTLVPLPALTYHFCSRYESVTVHQEESYMSESERVQRWREAKRQQGLESMTIWLSHEEKARLVDMAHRWHRSPSEMIQEALAQFDPISSSVTDTKTDTEQLRALVRDELTASSIVTAIATDTIV